MMRAFTAARNSAPKKCALNASRNVICRAAVPDHAAALDRRGLLLSVVGATLAVPTVLPAFAGTEGFTTFFGADTPPTSYGGYGGTMKETPKYVFEYPEEWKPSVVNKVQKGTQGIDCIINNPKVKGQRAFVITLARAGEDKVFKLTNYEATFQSFTGADYDMQDAVASGNLYSEERMIKDQLFYDYVIEGTDVTFRATITINNGKVYALFIRCPSRSYNGFKATADNMLNSFRTI